MAAPEKLEAANTHYERLRVPPEASEKEITAAFRKLALKLHPDRHQENKEIYEAQFKELNQAYEVLKDPSKRREYDMELRLRQQQRMGTQNARAGSFPFGFKPRHHTPNRNPIPPSTFKFKRGDKVKLNPRVESFYYGDPFETAQLSEAFTRDTPGVVVTVGKHRLVVDFPYMDGCYVLMTEVDLASPAVFTVNKKVRIRKTFRSNSPVLGILNPGDRVVADAVQSHFDVTPQLQCFKVRLIKPIKGWAPCIHHGTVILERNVNEDPSPFDIPPENCDCPGEHGLGSFTAAGAAYNCNICKTRISAGCTMYGCRLCNYDICHACYTIHNARREEILNGPPKPVDVNATYGHLKRPGQGDLPEEKVPQFTGDPFEHLKRHKKSAHPEPREKRRRHDKAMIV